MKKFFNIPSSALNLMTAAAGALKGLLTPKQLMEQYQARRLQHRMARLDRYRARNESYPYSSKRQLGIRGINHPSIFWSGKVAR